MSFPLDPPPFDPPTPQERELHWSQPKGQVCPKCGGEHAWCDPADPCPSAEVVNHPPHYTAFGKTYEPINVIEAWRLGFCLGNAVKYVARAGRKSPDAVTDLRKAVWYLEREISRLQSP